MTIARRIASKLGALLLTLFLASLLVFFSRFIVPGDPLSFLLRGRKPSPEAVAEISAQFGLDLPPWQQYLNWVGGIFRGDLGRSLQFRQDVSTVIGDRLPVTIGLVAMAAAIILIVGLTAGIVAALNKGRFADRAILILLTVFAAIPSFVGAILLISVFTVGLGWFPTFGSGDGLLDTIYHLFLPSLALALTFIVLIGRITRSAMIEQIGARTAMLGPLLVVAFSTVFGVLLGLVAAWRGGWIDAVLSRVFEVIFAFPALLIGIMAVALFGKGLTAPVIAMSLAYVPYVARLTRTLVLAERTRPYVSAYRVQGFSGSWIALRRVLPNVTPVVGAQSTLNFGYVLAELAALSFLGLGVQAPTADWGAMINEAKAGLIGGHFLPALVPAVAVVIVVVAVNIIGEELSERIGGGVAA